MCGEIEIGFHRDVINGSAEQKKPVMIDIGPEMIRWIPMPLIEGRDEKHAKIIIVIGLFSRRMVFALIDRRRPIMFVAVFFPWISSFILYYDSSPVDIIHISLS